MNAKVLPLLFILLLAGGGGNEEQEELETSKLPKKKKIPEPIATGPGGTVIDGNKIIEKSDFFNDAITDVRAIRQKVEDVDGMVLAMAAMYGIGAEAIVTYQAVKRLTHLVFPDEGESRLDILGEAVAAGMLDQVLGKFGVTKK